MRTDILIAGSYKGKGIAKNGNHGFDGKRLDTLYVSFCAWSKEELEEIIQTLNIQKHALVSKKNDDALR